MDRVRVALTGVGGFGKQHAAATDALAGEGLVEVVAFAEPDETAPLVGTLRSQGVRYYHNYYEMIHEEPSLDLVCLATPTPRVIRWQWPRSKRAFTCFLRDRRPLTSRTCGP